MYIPKINLFKDRDEIVAFMKQFSFGTIITSRDNLPIGTHLPFLVSIKEDKILLRHFQGQNKAAFIDFVKIQLAGDVF